MPDLSPSRRKSQETEGCRLAVVVPLANEESTVEDFLSQLLSQLSEKDRAFCVLDNVSQDSTMEKVREMALVDPRVRLVWAPENRCVVDAYFRGYREALAAECDWILEMDGGMSHLPSEIPRFIEAMKQDIDFAAGSRFTPGGKHRGSFWRRMVSRGGSVLANLLLGTRMKDMTSGFECFTRRALEHVVEQGVQSRGHFFQTEIRYMLSNWRWVEVPITYSNPSSRLGAQSILEALRNLWWLRRRHQKDKTATESTS